MFQHVHSHCCILSDELHASQLHESFGNVCGPGQAALVSLQQAATRQAGAC